MDALASHSIARIISARVTIVAIFGSRYARSSERITLRNGAQVGRGARLRAYGDALTCNTLLRRAQIGSAALGI